MTLAAGLDLGGTKCAVQVFDADWTCIKERRDPTPDTYDDLLALMIDQMRWAGDVPVGVSAAGRIRPDDGTVFAANFCGHGHPLPADLSRAMGREVAYLNDGQALVLSEAKLGAGKAHDRVAAVILGTGLGGGFAVRGNLSNGPTGLQGEVCHSALPAHIVDKYGLALDPCKCGRNGCLEYYLSGTGLKRLGGGLPAAWLALLAEHLHSLTVTLDPDIFVLAGGVTKTDGLLAALKPFVEEAQLDGFPMAPVVLAQGGDASGARGAAFAAWDASQ